MSKRPDKIGKYKIVKSLGEGAMGVVYEGFDQDIERRVALKILHPHLVNEKNGEEFLERFRREAQSAAKCTHPNVVTVLEYGQDGNMPFIVMEYVDGPSLQDIIKKGRAINLQKTLSIISQVLKALHYAHQLNIVHRDIKAANVMISREGGGVKLTDFGIARIAENPELTMTGAIVGTPKYMAPEQMFGLKADARADLFSVAMVFIELLSLLPKNSGIPCSSLPEIANLPPNNRVDYSILYPTALIPVLQKGLAITQEKRYQTAREFVQAIKLALPKLKAGTRAVADDATAVVQQSTQAPATSRDEVDSMTRLLIDYVGPIAKNIMVAHGSENTSTSELITAISMEIPKPEERADFLKRWQKMSGTRIDSTAMSNPGATARVQPGKFDDEMLEKIGVDYASYIGPLAARLVQLNSARASSLEQLVNSLADEIPDDADSRKFRNHWLQ